MHLGSQEETSQARIAKERRGQLVRSHRVWCAGLEAGGGSRWVAAGQAHGTGETERSAGEKVPQPLNVNPHWRGENSNHITDE